MLDHIYSSQVNKISPVSSKTESLHTLPVFVLLKGLLRSAGTENYIAGGGGGREGLVLRERAMESCLEKSCRRRREVVAQGRDGQVCVPSHLQS